jgi:hypothetical protein
MQNVKILKILLIASLSSLFSCWDGTLDVWKDGFYIFNWNINKTSGEIIFNLDVATSGWVGIGISKDGSMSNSDIIMGYIDKRGMPQVSDRFASGRNVPPQDTEQGGTDDLKNIKGTFTNKRTNITFSRKFDTGDKKDLPVVLGQKTNLLFSVGEEGNPSTENGVWRQHTKRISIPITFSAGGSSSLPNNTSVNLTTPSARS